MWVASTTWSKRSVPRSVATSTRSAKRRTWCTGVARRTSGSPATSFLTYSREPPFTVRHCGRFETARRPWLAQKCRKVCIGKRLICVAGVDQMQAAMGMR